MTVKTTVSSKAVTLSTSVTETTFSTYSDPCAYLFTQLKDTILDDVGAPSTSGFACSLASVTYSSDGRRVYKWLVTITWTE